MATNLMGLAARIGHNRELAGLHYPSDTKAGESLADALARDTGATSDHTLYGDTLGPVDSDGGTYLEMEAANANGLVSGFTDGNDPCQISP